MAGTPPPLSAQEAESLRSCLVGALDQSNPTVQRQAEAALASCEHRPGFCSSLAEIVGSKDEEHSVRYLAAVQFKNCISRNWRTLRTGSMCITPEEKAHLRAKLGSMVVQEDSQIALQVALVFAKVARLDYPKDWPSLFSDLMSISQAPLSVTQIPNSTSHPVHGNGQSNTASAAASPLAVRRVYLTLHHILKELASKRLAADQRTFESIAQQGLFAHIWEAWYADTRLLLDALPEALRGDGSSASGLHSLDGVGSSSTGGSSSPQSLLTLFERWLLLLKILRRLLLHGYPSDARTVAPVAAVGTCMPAMVQALEGLAAAARSAASAATTAGGAASSTSRRPAARSHLHAMLDRGVLKLLKTQASVQEVHPWSYHACGALLPTLEFCCDKVVLATGVDGGSSGSAGAAQERLQIQAMAFLIQILTCSPYKGRSSALAASPNPQQAQMVSTVQALLHGFWTAGDGGRLQALVSTLLSRIFPLTAKDLEAWMDDPEEFAHADDVGGAWQDHWRACAENLYLTMLQAHRAAVSQLVVQMLPAAAAACPTGVSPDQLPGVRVAGVPRVLLEKEALYNALAVGAYELHDHVDFPSWLRGSLLQELSECSPAAKPLRRRAAYVVAQWLACIPASDRPAIYTALLGLLSETGDLCLQLAAIHTFRTLIDDFGFDDSQFATFVGPVAERLMGVLQSSKELDTQTQAFSLLNLIIERMGESIRPYVEGIMSLLPGLWQDAEGQSLLRIQILLALQRLVNVLGPESPLAYPLVLPVLHYSLDVNQPESMNLVEDALGLWLVALRNAPLPPPQQTSPLLQPLPQLAAVVAASTEHIQVAMATVRSCLLLGGPPYLEAAQGVLSPMLASSLGALNERGTLLLFPVMSTAIALAPDAAPRLLQQPLVMLLAMMMGAQESTLVEAGALCVFARLLLQAPQHFISLLEYARAQGVSIRTIKGQSPPDVPLAPGEQLLSSFMALWLGHFDAIAQPPMRKLCALALCQLLLLPSRVVLFHLEEILSAITSVWYELEGGEDASGNAEAAAYNYDDAGGFDGGPTAAVDSEEAAGEVARRAALAETDPVNHASIGAALQEKLTACSTLHGQAFQQAMAQMDAAVTASLKAALRVAG